MSDVKPASFFKQGTVYKCRVDEYNKARLLEIAQTAEIGDEITLFARTERSKQEALAKRGTPIENQPTHNLSLVTAQEAKSRRDQWKANNPRPDSDSSGV